MDIKYLECACHSPDHTMRFHIEDDAIYLTVHLTHDTFYGRLKKAIKYIFGYTSRYGHFDEFIIQKDQQAKLSEILNGQT
jgi:hypothetical protein